MKFKEVQDAMEIYYNFCGMSPDEHKVEGFNTNIKSFSDYGRKRISVEGGYVIFGGIAYMMFKPSNSLLDWIVNFVFFKKKIPYNNVKNRKIKVHSGYMERYTLNSVRTNILLWLAKKNDVNEVVVIGYSMGGGLAPICAVDIAYNFPEKKVKCIALSSPRVGNKSFIKSLEKRVESVHFTYGNDAVPMLPPKLFGFEHISKRKIYNKKKWRIHFKDHNKNKLFNCIIKENPDEEI
jgi:hypothetical protein